MPLKHKSYTIVDWLSCLHILNQFSHFKEKIIDAVEILIENIAYQIAHPSKRSYKYTAQQKLSMVLILVRIRNNIFEVIDKHGNP